MLHKSTAIEYPSHNAQRITCQTLIIPRLPMDVKFFEKMNFELTTHMQKYLHTLAYPKRLNPNTFCGKINVNSVLLNCPITCMKINLFFG